MFNCNISQKAGNWILVSLFWVKFITMITAFIFSLILQNWTNCVDIPLEECISSWLIWDLNNVLHSLKCWGGQLTSPTCKNIGEEKWCFISDLLIILELLGIEKICQDISKQQILKLEWKVIIEMLWLSNLSICELTIDKGLHVVDLDLSIWEVGIVIVHGINSNVVFHDNFTKADELIDLVLLRESRAEEDVDILWILLYVFTLNSVDHCFDVLLDLGWEWTLISY